MQKPYVVIGWGSLLWDLELLAPHVNGMWQRGVGPLLPLEFTRISPKRKMGLAVCVDLMNGVECRTNIVLSTRATLHEAQQDLARRERTPSGNIGAVCMETGKNFGAPQIAFKVMQWLNGGPFAGAVWTDIGPNFAQETGLMFTVDDGIAYLKTLRGESLDEAVRYIHFAPIETQTHLRVALARDDWWQDQIARVTGG